MGELQDTGPFYKTVERKCQGGKEFQRRVFMRILSSFGVERIHIVAEDRGHDTMILMKKHVLNRGKQ